MSHDGESPGRYHIETWGCQMNVHDSEKLAGILEREGYARAPSVDLADVILLNTCSIREKAAEKVFSELGRLRPLKDARPSLMIGVCGCVAQQEGQAIFERAPYVDFVIGPRATGSLGDILARLRDGDPAARHRVDIEYRDDSVRFPFDEIRREGIGSGKAFVTIIEGCNHRCRYCIVPTTRGREICRDMDGVLDEIRSVLDQGAVEVELLGQTVNAYRDAHGRMLADLLLAASRIPGLERLRFTTSHPAQMTTRLLDAMRDARPVVCPYLHLPVQSGSSRVLRDMRRGYDREDYIGTIAALRERIPEISLGTDVIVGFPTETEPDFQETMSLLEEIRYDQVYSYTYSPRPGTTALALGDPVPDPVKRERLRTLQERQKEIQATAYSRWQGRDVQVLVDGPSKRDARKWSGRTAENRVVHFEGPSAPGRLEKLRIVETTPFCLHGQAVASFA